MVISVHLPHARLAPWISAYLRFESAAGTAAPERFFPLGEQFIVFLLEGSVQMANARRPDPAALRDAVVMGQATGAVRASMGPVRAVCVQCRPYGCHALLGTDMQRLTDTHRPLQDIVPEAAGLLDSLRRHPGRAEDLLDAFFLHHDRRTDLHGTDRIVDHIHARRGQVTVQQLCEDFCLTERTLQRQFARAVGLPPKRYCRMVRFNEAVRLIQQADGPEWEAIQEQCGYFDQSHFIRDFLAFADASPGRFHSGFRITREHLRQWLGL